MMDDIVLHFMFLVLGFGFLLKLRVFMHDG